MTLSAIVVIAANSIFIPATAYIARDFGVEEAAMSSNVAFSRISMIICMFSFAAFADLFSHRRLMQAGLAICLLSCVLSAVSVNIYMFDVAQFIEAMSRATVMLTMQLWIAGISNKDNLASRLSWYTILITLAPIIAPSAGGLITESASWQYCFIVLAILCAAMLFGSSIFKIQERTNENQNENPNGASRFSRDDQTTKKKFSPMQTLRDYRQIIMHSPLLRLNFSLAWTAWFDGAFMAAISFLFVDELGLNAAELGGIMMVMVIASFAGRFPVMYLSKRYHPRVTFLFYLVALLLALGGVHVYQLLTGRQDIVEIVVTMSLFRFGFSGLYIYCLRTTMVVDADKKSAYASLFNTLYSVAALLGVITVQVLYSADLTSVSVFLITVGVTAVAVFIGGPIHLRALRTVKN